MRDVLEDELLDNAAGAATSLATLMQLVNIVVSSLVGIAWPEAFRGCGFGDSQTKLGNRARRALEWPDAVPAVSDDLPTLEEIQCVWPQRKGIPLDWLFRTPLILEETRRRADRLRLRDRMG